MGFRSFLRATALLLAISLTPANAGLIVDFGVTGAPVVAGATSGNVANNQGSGSAVPVTVVNLSGLATGFGTASVQGVVSMASGNIPNNTFRAINRTPGVKAVTVNPGLNNNTSNDDLFRDWISVTQLTTTTSGVITNNPAPKLTFTISGLDPGQYIWTSWHHDIDDQTGLINYTFTDASGPATGVINVSHGASAASGSNTGLPANSVNGRGPAVNGTGDPINNPPGTPTSFSRAFTVDGSGSFTFDMVSGYDPSLSNATTNLPNTVTSLNFALINGFEVVPLPEPGSIALLVGTLGLVAMHFGRNRQR